VAGEGLETRHSELRRRSRLLPRTRAPLPALPRCVCASSNTENEMWPGETDKAGELGASAACSFQVRSSILHLRLRCIRYKLHHYRRCPLSIVRATTRGLKASLSSAADIRAQPAASPRSRSRCWTPGAGERHVGVGAVVTLAGPLCNLAWGTEFGSHRTARRRTACRAKWTGLHSPVPRPGSRPPTPSASRSRDHERAPRAAPGSPGGAARAGGRPAPCGREHSIARTPPSAERNISRCPSYHDWAGRVPYK